jgi:hypothetical protein
MSQIYACLGGQINATGLDWPWYLKHNRWTYHSVCKQKRQAWRAYSHGEFNHSSPVYILWHINSTNFILHNFNLLVIRRESGIWNSPHNRALQQHTLVLRATDATGLMSSADASFTAPIFIIEYSRPIHHLLNHHRQPKLSETPAYRN